MRLGSRTWPDLARGAPPRLLVPLGATEQHGPHLPLATDTIIATALAERAALERPGLAVAPALPYGASGEHAGFPGTLSLGRDALTAALVELVRSADHFADVVLVSWHGGNAEAVGRAIARSRRDGRRASCWEPSLAAVGGDAHAGRIETSLMLAIAPELVGAARPIGRTEPLAALLPELRRHGVRALSPTGVLGDAQGASGAEGQALLGALTADLGRFLEAPQPMAASA